jgi:hypothetical protein
MQNKYGKLVLSTKQFDISIYAILLSASIGPFLFLVLFTEAKMNSSINLQQSFYLGMSWYVDTFDKMMAEVSVQDLFDRMLKEGNPAYAVSLLRNYSADKLDENQRKIAVKTVIDFIKKGLHLPLVAFMFLNDRYNKGIFSNYRLSKDQREEIIEAFIDGVLKVGDIHGARMLLQHFSDDLGSQRKRITKTLLDWVLEERDVDKTLFNRVLEEGDVDKTLFGRVLGFSSLDGWPDVTLVDRLIKESDVDKTFFGHVLRKRNIDKTCFDRLLKRSTNLCSMILLQNCSDVDLSKDQRKKIIEILIRALKEECVADYAEVLWQDDLNVDQRKEIYEIILDWVRGNAYLELIVGRLFAPDPNDLSPGDRKMMAVSIGKLIKDHCSLSWVQKYLSIE